jgi:geranylgeranyl pyrophosphate synthase
VTNELAAFIARHHQPIEDALAEHLPRSCHAGVGRLNEALFAAVFPGGKRMRPLLTLMGAAVAGVAARAAMPAAAAVEYLHSSSLILDDLPAMDDAEMRRGRAALHLAYGEGVAMLAALALLNQSYALLALAAASGGAPALAPVMREATACIGANGMIGGQAADIERRAVTDGFVALNTRNLKTTALLRLTMIAGAMAGGAGRGAVAALARYGECLGFAYQIYDDLLDELGDSGELGKPAGQDARHERPSLVAEFGVDGARHMAASLVEQAKSAIAERFGHAGEARLLADAADSIFRDLGRRESVAGMVA